MISDLLFLPILLGATEILLSMLSGQLSIQWCQFQTISHLHKQVHTTVIARTIKMITHMSTQVYSIILTTDF
jgi:hypothetical protein